MSKFCGNCGATLDDAAVVCGYCGAPLAATPNNNKPNKINSAGFTSVLKEITSNKIFKIAVPAVIGIVVIIITISIISSFTGYKGAIKDFVKAYEDMDVDTMIEMSSDLATKGQDDDAVEDLEEKLNDHFDHIDEELKTTPEIDYEILTDDKLKDSQLNKYKDMFDDLDLSSSDINQARKVKIRFTYKYDERTKTRTSTFIMFKEGGDWKFYNVDQYPKYDKEYSYDSFGINVYSFSKNDY